MKSGFAGMVTKVVGEGSCAIIGITAKQARLTALQRARADAIEKASGIKVAANTIVTNGKLAVDLIKTFTSGYIVSEKKEWLPLGEYRSEESAVPIPEYRVRIEAEVMVPEKLVDVGLEAKLNKITFIKGDKAFIKIKARKDAQFAIFNLMANDKVVMLYPNTYHREKMLTKGEEFLFPEKGAIYDLEMSTFDGHSQDSEAFLIAATDDKTVNFNLLYGYAEELTFTEFYNKYSKIADKVQEVILPYQVFEK
ncbi:MAG: hypothetical protein PWQ25_1650 [Deferribacteres bacterium]|nr:hypothetical protein [Deferribacteraceae bacterium]MDK2792787.1 hypothetical protein [Deferribacteres bacterium]